MRQFFQIAVPLLLPALVYFLYLNLARRRAGAAETPPDVPWAWLAVAGAALVVVTFAALSFMDGAPPGSEYVPPKLIDGKIQPGHFAN